MQNLNKLLDDCSLDPEREDDHIEYKRHLLDIDERKFKGLASQLKHRLINGGNECTYEIGVDDDGTICGITDDQTQESLKNLEKLAKFNNAQITSTFSKEISTDLIYTQVLIREFDLEFPIDVSIAALGHVNCSKSSLLGTLVTGELDDGNGYTRSFVTNHKHELVGGQTSSIGFHLVGFDEKGNMITSTETKRYKSWINITKSSKKVISFIDLCGHNKYFKTTISGITGLKPDYAMILVESTKGVQGLQKRIGLKHTIGTDNNIVRNNRNTKPTPQGMTIEHISLCRDQNIPFIMLITKIDIGKQYPDILNKNINTIEKIIKNGMGKQSFEIKSEEDVHTAIKLFKVSDSGSYSIIPYMRISCKTGENLDLLRLFLNYLPKRCNYKEKYDKPLRGSVIEQFNVEGVGLVLHIFLESGTVKISDKVWIGPDTGGNYTACVIKNIEYKRTKVPKASCGKMITINLRDGHKKSKYRRGMVVLDREPTTSPVKKFKADVYIKEHSTTIHPGYECALHIDNIRETIRIVDIITDQEIKQLLPGNRGELVIEFIHRPVSIIEGTKFIFRESNTKGSGTVLELL